MKKKVAIHLETLTTDFLTGVDFQNLAKIGSKNIQAIIHFLETNRTYRESQIEEEEEKLFRVKNDVMEVEKIASYINYLKIQLGNRKLLLSNLKTIFFQLTKDYNFNYPLLPTLRIFSPFRPGDDVMVYLGKTGLKNNYEEKISSSFDWVNGKVISFIDNPDEYTVNVFLNYSYGSDKNVSLDGHYRRQMAMSPTIFNRKEFFLIREMIENNKDSDFIELFFKNSKHSPYKYKIEPWPDYETMKKMILNPKIEPTNDEELSKNQLNLIENILKITNNHQLFVEEAEKMAKAMGHKVK